MFKKGIQSVYNMNARDDYKELFNLCFDYSDNLMLVLSENLIIENINPAAEKILGWDKNEVCGKKISHIFESKAIHPFIDQTNSLLKTKKTTEILHNERNHTINWDIVPIYHEDKKCTSIFIIGKDRAELTPRQLENLQLESVVKYAPSFFYWKDANSVYQGCNDEFARLAGLNSSIEVKGKTDYDLIWKDRAELYVETDQSVLLTGKARLNHEETITISDNITITAITNKVPLLDDRNNVVGILGITTDISDLKEAKERAEVANHAKTEFIANMSHDIRTPLTGVVGMSKMLEDKVHDPDHKQYAQWLNQSGTQLLNMLNVILDTVSAENVNEKDVHEEPFDLHQVIQEILQLERPSTITKGIELQTYVDEDIPSCLISDYTKIHRILLNLLGNAIKFTQTGKIDIDVMLLKNTKTHALLHFSVTDTGIGIPYDLQAKVFDKFFRVTPSYKGVYTGHGLGLHIAQSYANLLGGTILLSSEPGVGTTFYFDLSLKIGDKAPDKVQLKPNGTLKVKQPHLPAETPITPPSNAPKLLLVEDNHIALLTLENIATQAGCSFKSAIDGESALNLIKKELFDLVITDLGLPGLSGIELSHKIRKYEKDHHKQPIPIIGLTAHAEKKIKKECMQAGMNDAFTKPMNPETLEKIKLTYLSINNSATKKTKLSTQKQSKKLGLDLPDYEKELFKLDSFPLLDANSALTSMGNNAVLLNDILKSMIEQEIPNDLIELQIAHASGDWEAIEKLAHRMKGGLVYCGAVKLVHACQYLERYRKAGHSQFLEPLYEQLCLVVDETKDAITQWLRQ